MKHMDQLTVITTLRIDSFERLRNLRVMLHYLSPLGVRILLLEADKNPIFQEESADFNIEYYFVSDERPVFHRTHYLNLLLKKSTTPVVAVWDVDMIVSYSQLEASIKAVLEGGDIINIPYNGRMVLLSPVQSTKYANSMGDYRILQEAETQYTICAKRPSCGGIFMANREVYLNCGGENEFFYGWGPEDAERIRRVEILNHPVHWLSNGFSFHLWHPCGDNSCFSNESQAFKNRQEFIKVCNMDCVDLRKYIKTWN